MTHSVPYSGWSVFIGCQEPYLLSSLTHQPPLLYLVPGADKSKVHRHRVLPDPGFSCSSVCLRALSSRLPKLPLHTFSHQSAHDFFFFLLHFNFITTVIFTLCLKFFSLSDGLYLPENRFPVFYRAVIPIPITRTGMPLVDGERIMDCKFDIYERYYSHLSDLQILAGRN